MISIILPTAGINANKFVTTWWVSNWKKPVAPESQERKTLAGERYSPQAACHLGAAQSTPDAYMTPQIKWERTKHDTAAPKVAPLD